MSRRAHELCRVGPVEPGLCRLPGRASQLPAGRPRRHHAAEPARLSGGVFRRAARRPDRGQRQSAVHAARTERAACGFRRRSHRDHGKLRPQARTGAGADADPSRGGGAARRFHAGAQARHLQFRQHLYPPRGTALALPHFHDAAGGLHAPPERALCRRAGGGDCAGFAAIYRRHDRGAEGRDPDASQSGRQHAAVPRLDRAEPRGRPPHGAHAAAALSHLLADGEPAWPSC